MGSTKPLVFTLHRRVGWSNLTDFIKFVGILLATQVLISLTGFCVNFINIFTGTNKMLGIVVYFCLTYF